MEVHSISSNPSFNTVRIGGCRKNAVVQTNYNNSFQPVFGSYEKILKQSVKNVLNNDSEVEKSFKDLFWAVSENNDFVKTSEYYGIADTYHKHGLRGLLYELWKSVPQENLQKYLQHGAITLVKKDDKPLFELIHFYKFGFSKNSPNDVKLAFSNPKTETYIQYGLNKKGELDVWQTGDDSTVITTYHLTTGNKKCVVEHYHNGNPETTYYNKDGSKAFWKNVFWGGVAIIPK